MGQRPVTPAPGTHRASFHPLGSVCAQVACETPGAGCHLARERGGSVPTHPAGSELLLPTRVSHRQGGVARSGYDLC